MREPLKRTPRQQERIQHARRQQMHAEGRATERYGLKFTRDDRFEIARMIFEKDGVRKQQQGDGRYLCWLTYKDQPVKIVFDKSNGTVVTFLPWTDPPPSKNARRKIRRKEALKSRFEERCRRRCYRPEDDAGDQP